MIQQNTSRSNQDEALLTCPVMKGIPVDRNEAESLGLVRDYKGKKYYFCCNSCSPMFDQDPEVYVM